MRLPRNHNPPITNVPNMEYEYLKNSIENRAARKEARQRFWLMVGTLAALGWVVWMVF